MPHAPRRTLKVARALIVISLSVGLSGCGGSGGGISGMTTLEFRGLTPDDAKTIESTLIGEQLRVVRKDGPQGTTFQTRDITTAKQLGSVHNKILSVARARQIEMNFDGTTLQYTSLTASGSASTTVTIQASPGATAYIADQDGANPWRLIRLDSSGRWQGAVRTGGRVNEQGGWLYVAFTRDGSLYRYLRVNVLTSAQENTSYSQAQKSGLSEPPAGSAGAATPSATESGEASKSSSGFKWPWE